MKTLDIKQINNLITGNSLAVEIKSSEDELMAYVVAGSYTIDKQGQAKRRSKFINDSEKTNTLFWIRKYEIDKKYIENQWDVAEGDLVNSVLLNGITSINELEKELSKHLDDFSGLDVSWKCGNPI